MLSKLGVDKFEDSNPKTFRLLDASEYNPDIEVNNALLEITPPGFNTTVLKVDPKFNIVINASLLNILKVKTYSKLPNLPDGIYKIKYSINPNNKTAIEENYFRLTLLNQKYYKAVYTLLSKKCDMHLSDFEAQKREIIWIREVIDAAKFAVEEVCDTQKGIEFYSEANDLLNTYLKIAC